MNLPSVKFNLSAACSGRGDTTLLLKEKKELERVKKE